MSGHASGSAVVGVTIAMTCLAGLAVFSRLFARLVVVRNAGLDDGFIVGALLFSIATTVTMCLQGQYSIKANLSPYQTGANVESSEMGHGPTHEHIIPLRKRPITKALLHIHLGLQPLDVLHQILDPAPIPSNLSAATFQESLLCYDRHRCGLHLLDILQRCFCLLADLVLLDKA